MLTDLGKMLRNLCTNAGLKQEELAAELGCAPGTLSNYMNGKTVPEMDKLVKCVDQFGLKGKELKELFSKAFFGTIQNNQKIVLDTRFFRKDRLEPLVQVIVALLLYSDIQSELESVPDLPLLTNLLRSIGSRYDAMDTDRFLELVRPSQNSE